MVAVPCPGKWPAPIMAHTETAAMDWQSEHFSNNFDESPTTATCFVSFLGDAEAGERGSAFLGILDSDGESAMKTGARRVKAVRAGHDPKSAPVSLLAAGEAPGGFAPAAENSSNDNPTLA